MKKRIGNDIAFTWYINRRNNGTSIPESFTGKNVTVELITPSRTAAQIEDVSVDTGVVTFLFPGKYQKELGVYTAVLYENRGNDNMVALDYVRAVTLVAHSCQEDDGTEDIEAKSVQLQSYISSGGGSMPADTYSKGVIDEMMGKKATIVFLEDYRPSGAHAGEALPFSGCVYLLDRDSMKPCHWRYHEDDATLPSGLTFCTGHEGGTTEADVYIDFRADGNNYYPLYYNAAWDYGQAPQWVKDLFGEYKDATPSTHGLMSAEDKRKLDKIQGGSSAKDTTYDNTRTGLSATNVQDAIDEMADTKLFETVVLTVGSADSSFSPVGQTITVTLEDGSATQYTVPMSRQITFIVQRGMRYTISGTSTDDYRVLPISVKAAIPTRYLTIRYIPIATGVFILQSDGNYYLRDEYDAETMAEDAVGVLILTSELINAGFGIVIGKEDVYVTKTRVYCATVASNTETGYNGVLYTEKLAGANDPAAVYCKDMVITLDNQVLLGFLAAYNEAAIIHRNREEIRMCLYTINGTAIEYTGGWSTSSCKDYMNIGARFRSAAGGYLSTGGNHSIRPCYKYPLS